MIIWDQWLSIFNVKIKNIFHILQNSRLNSLIAFDLVLTWHFESIFLMKMVALFIYLSIYLFCLFIGSSLNGHISARKCCVIEHILLTDESCFFFFFFNLRELIFYTQFIKVKLTFLSFLWQWTVQLKHLLNPL